MALAVAVNRAVRDADEWFSEPDDLDAPGAARSVDVTERVAEHWVRPARRAAEDRLLRPEEDHDHGRHKTEHNDGDAPSQIPLGSGGGVRRGGEL